VLENSTPWSALTVAERLRQKIIKEDIRFEEGAEERLSVSIGIFHPQAQDINNPVNIFELIDIAVQQAKAQGKNAIFLLD
jgi:diguanylate cyclase (GGDEF)-like protein